MKSTDHVGLLKSKTLRIQAPLLITMTLSKSLNFQFLHLLVEKKGAGRDAVVLSHIQLFETPKTMAFQTPLSMGLSRQEYWSEWPFPSQEDLPNPGIQPGSPALQADSLLSELPGKPWHL